MNIWKEVLKPLFEKTMETAKNTLPEELNSLLELLPYIIIVIILFLVVNYIPKIIKKRKHKKEKQRL